MTQGAQQILIDSIPSIAMVQMMPALMQAPMQISKIYNDENKRSKHKKSKAKSKYKKVQVK